MRLLVSPILKALKQMGADSKYLDFIDSFRYPLSGEFSMFRDVVATIPTMSARWISRMQR